MHMPLSPGGFSKAILGPGQASWRSTRWQISYKCKFSVAVRRQEQHESNQHSSTAATGQSNANHEGDVKRQGAMSQRLTQMMEDGLADESSRHKAQEIVDAAGSGFDEDLRRRLEERLLSADTARAEHPQAFAIMDLPSSAGRGTREIASAAPWTGEEPLADAALRMLADAHKPLRIGRSQAVNPVVRLPLKRKRTSVGNRLAEARDRSQIYSNYKAGENKDETREEYKKELRARFEPTARPMPATLSGLASLANERIEDAIARGQFKNLPRGKKLETDYNANSPFINTTEYLMNKMIKRQEIVPPWIEKQQEVTNAVRIFRARVRNDWKRHAARLIASKGGSLEDKIQRAKDYAAAEMALLQPSISVSENSEQRSQISEAGVLHVERDAVERESELTPQTESLRIQPIFRDPDWERTEQAFHKVSIDALNTQTRAYNLIAPQLAQKPYYNLDRELKSCFADVAPLLPDEILKRAIAPPIKASTIPGSAGLPLLGRFERDRAPVHDEDIRKKGYGWRQFWRDLWSSNALSR